MREVKGFRQKKKYCEEWFDCEGREKEEEEGGEKMLVFKYPKAPLSHSQQCSKVKLHQC